MPISKTDQLFSLVKSLTKAEKRNFKIYASRIQDSNSMKYIKLFEVMDKMKELDEKQINDKFPKGQISNLKRHLYSQILISLRLIHKKRHVYIEIRELLDFADILYNKGLYLQALKLLEKANTLTDKTQDGLIYLMIIEFEKKIESRHITRSGTEKSHQLRAIAEKRLESVSNTIRISNLSLYLHSLYIQQGHIKSEKEQREVMALFEDNVSKIPLTQLNLIERVLLYKSFVWYYYILIDFVNCYSYALKWVNLLKSSPEIVERDPNLLMRGYHYLLTSAYNIMDVENYIRYLNELEQFRKSEYKKFNTNTQITSFLYVHNGRLNKYFLTGQFDQGLESVPKTLRRINRYGDKLDAHRIMVLYYKIAWMYFGAGKPSQAIKYLNRIMTMEMGILREDIQCYTRLMHLMAHYDLENYDILDYLIKNADSFFKKIESLNQLQIMTLVFFKNINKLPLNERQNSFAEFERELVKLYHDKYEGKAFFYLDILSWVRAKVSHQSLAKVVKDKLEE